MSQSAKEHCESNFIRQEPKTHLNPRFYLPDVVDDGLGLGLGVGSGTAEDVAALVVAGPLAAPLVAVVAVEVDPEAGAGAGGPVLPPEPVPVGAVRELVPVRVHHRHHVVVYLLHLLRQVVPVLRQLPRDVQHRRRGDPLPRVDSCAKYISNVQISQKERTHENCLNGYLKRENILTGTGTSKKQLGTHEAGLNRIIHLSLVRNNDLLLRVPWRF